MKKIIILLSLTLSAPYLGCAQFDTLYMNLQPDANEFLPLVISQENEYWCFGKAINLEGDHFRIKKVNGQGEVLEVVDSIAYAPYIYIYGIRPIVTSDNGILLASVIDGPMPNTVIGKTIKFNNDLSIAWSHIQEGIYTDSTYFGWNFATEISEKAFVVSGSYREMGDGGILTNRPGQIIMKIDSLGNTVWYRTELQPEGTPYGIYSNEIIELANDELIHLRWYHHPGHYLSRIELQRLAANGDVIESHLWDEAYHYGQPAAIIKDGFLYMIYGTHQDEVYMLDPIQTDVRFKKFNIETWQEEWDVPMDIETLDDIHHTTFIVDFYELDNGELVILGQGSPWVHYPYGIGFLVNFNLDGSINWEKAFDPYPHNDPNIPVHGFLDMIVCPDGGYMITGYIDDIMLQSQKQHLIKTDPCGDVVFSGCGVGVNELFQTKQSVAVYPNPATSQLTLSLKNNKTLNIISIFDLHGKLILHESIKPYQDNKTLDVSALPTGVYMLQMMDEQGNMDTVKWVKE